MNNSLSDKISFNSQALTDEQKAQVRDNIGALAAGVTIATSNIVHSDDNQLLSEIIKNYLLNVDYSTLAFDTSEIVFGGVSTTSILGQAMLGRMILG